MNLAIAAVDVVGTSFVVLADYTAEDTMTVIVSGEASLWPLSADDSQKVNAAGVLTNANAGGCVTTAAILIPTVCAGALLIGNDKLGFRPIFPANAANGLGSLKPPLVMSLEAQPSSSILGSSFAIPSGTILFLKLNDSLYSDNGGGFRTGPPLAAN